MAEATVDIRARRHIRSGMGIATLVAWAATGAFAWAMAAMDHAAMPAIDAQTWSAAEFALAFLMWASMMAAMMLPSAVPMVDAFATIAGRRRERSAPYTPTAIFVTGYLIVWTAFSGAATLLQWAFHKAAWLTPMMENASPAMAAAALLLAGGYQFTPLKRACLTHCRTPAAFILSDWQDGHAGAVIMGIRHGAFCVGCCWALMGLLFAVAVMSVGWMAALTAVVTIEKVAPWGDKFARFVGIAAIAGGTAILIRLAAG